MPDRPAEPRSQPSLDEIVSQRAVVIAEQIQKAAAWAKSEMDLQIDVASALEAFARDAKITLGGHHNVTVATGRPDSVYGSVIVEYKDPGTLSPNKDAAPNRAVIDQLKRRFHDMRRAENRQWNSMFGVGTASRSFGFEDGVTPAHPRTSPQTRCMRRTWGQQLYGSLNKHCWIQG